MVPTGQDDRRLVAVWVALAVVLALFVGTGAAVLAWISNRDVPAAVLTGGAAFAGALTLAVVLIVLFRD